MVIYRVFFIALAKAAEAATRQKEAEEKAALNEKNKAEKFESGYRRTEHLIFDLEAGHLNNVRCKSPSGVA